MQAFDRLFLNTLNGCCRLRYPALTRKFVEQQKRIPDIALPRDYYERMQWRKIFDRNPLFVTFCDKLATKDYLAKAVPKLRIPKTLWSGRTFAQMPRDVLAGNVVVKTNHGSSYNYFVRDGRYDPAALSRATRKWMVKRAYGRETAELAYLQVPPQLFVEEMLLPSSGELVELNIRAGNGRIAYGNILLFAKTPKQSAIYIDAARRIVGRTYGEGVTKAEIDRIAIPETYDEAVRYAVDLSRDVDFARYDFFSVDGELYGGEITVYPAAGFAPVPQFPDGTGTRRPDSLAQAILENWDIRTSWFMTAPLSGWKTHYRDVLMRNGFGMPPEK